MSRVGVCTRACGCEHVHDGTQRSQSLVSGVFTIALHLFFFLFFLNFHCPEVEVVFCFLFKTYSFLFDGRCLHVCTRSVHEGQNRMLEPPGPEITNCDPPRMWELGIELGSSGKNQPVLLTIEPSHFISSHLSFLHLIFLRPGAPP